MADRAKLDKLLAHKVQFEKQLAALECSAHPDFDAISEISLKLQRLGEAIKSTEQSIQDKDHQYRNFEQDALDASRRYVDPSVYGEGAKINTAHVESDIKTPPKEPAPSAAQKALSEQHDAIKVYLIKEVIRQAYATVTRDGRMALQIALSEEGPRAGKFMKRFQSLLRLGFKRIMDQLSLDADSSHAIIHQLVIDLEKEISDIEYKDEGSLRIIRNVVARMFLKSESLLELGKQGIL